MILPILISVSLAPASYFFCALAVVAISAAATNAATAAKYFGRASIVFSRFCDLFCCQVSQVALALASAALFRPTKQHCCLPLIVIDLRAGFTASRQAVARARNTCRSAASPHRECGLSPHALAHPADDGSSWAARVGQHVCKPEACVDQGTIATRRDRLHRWPRLSGNPQHRGCTDRGHAERRAAHHLQQRGGTFFRQQAYNRISATLAPGHARDVAGGGTRRRRYRCLRHDVGLSGPAGAADSHRARGGAW